MSHIKIAQNPQIINFNQFFNRKILYSFRADIDQEFNELEIIQLIPLIIDQIKLNRITKPEYQILRHVFGSLFHLIVEESHRRTNEPMNPVLQSLLSAQKYRVHRFTNDIHKNTMDTIMEKYDIDDNDKIAMKLAMHINRKLSPSQRILTAAALLIHENGRKSQDNRLEPTNNEKTKRVGQSPPTRDDHSEKALLSLELLQANGSKRSKRSTVFDSLSDEQMKVLQELIDNDDKEYSDEYYDQLADLNSKRTDDIDTVTYQDYAFDVTAMEADDDDEFLRSMYGNRQSNDYSEYGTISELLQLAAKHNLRKQRNSDYLKMSRDEIGPVSIDDYYDDV